MASIRQQGTRFEIRECRSTERGPRQFTLARFDRILTPGVLDDAAARARRPFDRDAVVMRARQQGIPVAQASRSAEARRLLASLRAGGRLEPGVVALLRDALEPLEARPVAPHLAEAAEWLGESELARGKALRGLLRAAGRVMQSRGPLREREPDSFPRFSTGEGFAEVAAGVPAKMHVALR